MVARGAYHRAALDDGAPIDALTSVHVSPYEHHSCKYDAEGKDASSVQHGRLRG